MALPLSIIKKRGIPLNIVNLSKSKRLKIQRVSADKRAGLNSVNQLEEASPDHMEPSDHAIHQGSCSFDCSDDVLGEDANSLNDLAQSLHTRRKIKAAERWESIQTVAMNTVVYGYSQPRYICNACQSESGIVKCYNCSPLYFYCETCAIQYHKHKLFHHFMEIWQVPACCNVVYLNSITYQ